MSTFFSYILFAYIKYNSYLCDTIKIKDNMKKTIEIRRWDNNEVIFSYTCKNNSFSKTLEEAIKKNVDLSVASLGCKVLSNVNLSHAKLRYASFVKSQLINVNFNGADLTGANFTFSVLTDVTFDNAVGINDQCPKTGSFIGWKKCIGDNKIRYIVKLEIPADAKRSSGTDRKCRCSKAKVLEIQNLDGTIANINTVYSLRYESFAYKVGETIYPDSFNEEFWVECSHGIHFFMNRQDAIAW